MEKTSGKEPRLRGLRPRVVALATAYWMLVGVAAHFTGLLDGIDRVLTEPLELKARLALQRAPEIDSKLKIFNLDDTTFAHLRRPGLSGGQWAGLIRSLTAAHPRAIVTTHMFGTGEMDDENGALGAALRAAKARGTDVVAGVFAYPAPLRYRDPVPLSLFSFVEGAGAARAKNLLGWRVYGPDANVAAGFTRLGHQGYEGDGRASLLVRVGQGELVPHLALAVAHSIRVTAGGVAADGVEVPLDGAGRTRIDLLPAARLAERSKSLDALLADADAGAKARYVDEGDVVLLLMDMYTGKVNFAPTPTGPVPGGYLWAAVLNSLLSGHWLREAGGDLAACLLAPVVGAAAGIAADGLVFIAGLNFLPLVVVAAGIASFILRGVSVPWMPTVILAWAAACTLFFLKARSRQAKATSLEVASDREAARLAAIVRTAQMFAHDVRKPFSLLNMALVAIKREPNPARVGALLANLAPELARAMSSVEAMIKDIMEVDAHARLEAKETDLAELVRQALKDVLPLRASADVLVSFKLTHSLPAEVDTARIARVVANIIDNAVQAMGGRGRLWVNTQEVIERGRCFIHLVIGNSGSFVAQADRTRIFEAFFTSGKKDGTGLGLAIAHKVVAGHGGRIWCESDREIGTEFHLTLPVAQATPAVVPGVEGTLRLSPLAAAGAEAHASGDGAAATGVHAPGRDAAAPTHRPWRYAVVDDNAFVLEAWELVAQGEALATFSGPEELFARIAGDPGFLAGLDALVTDFHFDGSPFDGLELARRVKDLRPDLPVFLSTDGDVEYLPGDGIEARIAKEPVTFAELLKRRSAV